MNITLLQGFFLPVPPRRGGAVEKQWYRLGQEFAARGHRVTHVSRRCDGLPEGEVIGGVKHVRIRGYDHARSNVTNLYHDGLYTLRARRVLPRADILVTNTFWAPVAAAAGQGRVVVDVQRMPRGQLRLYRGAARLRANSSAVVAAIAAEAPWAASRVRMIPNALPSPPVDPVRWERKTKTILYVGRLHEEKGIALLLQAWQKAATWPGFRDWQLDLVGPVKVAEGGSGEAWQAGLQQRYPAPRVRWHPPVFDDAGLARHYEAARVFVYPSLAEKGETFGSAVLEAMAWGAVPVVSDLACFRDFVSTGANGFAFDHRSASPDTALASALQEAGSDAAEPLARAAVNVRASHAPGAIAAQFLADFKSLP